MKLTPRQKALIKSLQSRGFSQEDAELAAMTTTQIVLWWLKNIVGLFILAGCFYALYILLPT